MTTRRFTLIISSVIAILCGIPSQAQLRFPENVAISFYGKVIDQEGLPVIGAKINFDLIYSYMAEDRTKTTPMTLQTGQSGNFVLTGITGYGIDKISIQKEGYELSQKASRGYVFGLTDYQPNPNNPVIFRMWKIVGKEPLIGSAWHGKVACDGTPVDFDLYHGLRGTNGSLQITCTRTPLNFERTSRQPFNYKLEIAITGGGIQPTEDEFTYLAPASGYSPQLTIERKAGDPKWGGGLKQEFYIRTAKGEYGRLSVEWDSGHRPAPTPLKWDSSINPSGSRNLER